VPPFARAGYYREPSTDPRQGARGQRVLSLSGNSAHPPAKHRKCRAVQREEPAGGRRAFGAAHGDKVVPGAVGRRLRWSVSSYERRRSAFIAAVGSVAAPATRSRARARLRTGPSVSLGRPAVLCGWPSVGGALCGGLSGGAVPPAWSGRRGSGKRCPVGRSLRLWRARERGLLGPGAFLSAAPPSLTGGTFFSLPRVFRATVFPSLFAGPRRFRRSDWAARGLPNGAR